MLQYFLLLTFVNTALALSMPEAEKKLAEAKKRFAATQKRTKEMAEKIHAQTLANMTKLEEEKKKEDKMIADNMKSLNALLEKDKKLKHSMKPVPSSFLQETDNSPSAIEKEASETTEKLLKELRELQNSPSKPTSSSFAEETEDDDQNSEPTVPSAPAVADDDDDDDEDNDDDDDMRRPSFIEKNKKITSPALIGLEKATQRMKALRESIHKKTIERSLK
jgi:hypothetical protein